MLYWKCCATNAVLKRLYGEITNNKMLCREELHRQMLYETTTLENNVQEKVVQEKAVHENVVQEQNCTGKELYRKVYREC